MTRLFTTNEVAFPALLGGPYTPEAVPTYTLYPVTPVVVVGGIQLSDAFVVDDVVGAVVVVDAVGELVVANLTVSPSTRPPVYWLCVNVSVLLPVLQAETGTGI